MPDDVTILIIDDHRLFREALAELLTAEGGLRVVGNVRTGHEGLSIAAERRPDVILLDVSIPGEDVTATVRALRRVSAASRIIIVSVHDEPWLVRRLLTLDVNGYLVKTVSREELISAIRGTGDTDRVTVSLPKEALAGQETSSVLSKREQEVLSLVAEALSNAQVASRLGITEGTVKRHLKNIFTKLGAVSRIDAVNKAAAVTLQAPGQTQGQVPGGQPGGQGLGQAPGARAVRRRP